ncbi:hypothetical protein KKF34_13280 [Myxococcota bacterium]|nr:hypothetical protein [Myxococcota bacterium]MBU1381940.1 hypothetical protein [Myxococcota bacterium]MBU1497841.1 hypothetical protein [Myxococcota bacterium]
MYRFLSVGLLFIFISCSKNSDGTQPKTVDCANSASIACAQKYEKENNSRSLDIYSSECLKGNQQACDSLKSILTDIIPLNTDYEKRTHLINITENICSKKISWGCELLYTTELSRGLSQDQFRDFFNYSYDLCRKGNRQWCDELRNNIHRIGFLRLDTATLEGIYTAGCRAKSALSCEMAATLRERRRQMSESIEYYLLSCRYGHHTGCLNSFRLILSGLTSFKSSISYYDSLKTLCQTGYRRACIFQAKALTGAWFGTKNRDEAHRILKDNCIKGEDDACIELGISFTQTGDKDKGTDIFRRSCFMGSENGCVHYAQAMATGIGMKADPASAAKLLYSKCYKSNNYNRYRYYRYRHYSYQNQKYPTNGQACGALGIMYITKTATDGDEKTGVSLAMASCKNNHADACAALLDVGIEKKLFTIDSTFAMKIKSFCTLGHAPSCFAAAKAHRISGPYFYKNETAAKNYIKKGCLIDPTNPACK